MIYALRGIVSEVRDGFFVLECGGVFFKVLANGSFLQNLKVGEPAKVFCSMHLREDEPPELFGFSDEAALRLFQLLHSVSGIGPRTALRVLEIGSVPRIIAAIVERDAALLSTVPGIGRKTAERVILELHGRVSVHEAGELVKTMKVDQEVEDALVGLGYQRGQAREAARGIEADAQGFEARFRAAIKSLGR